MKDKIAAAMKTSHILILAVVCLLPTVATAQLMNRTVDVDGVTREFLMYLPSSYDPSSPSPMMLSYHGGSGTANDQLQLSDMRSLADANGVILAYPQGLPDDAGDPIWNSIGPYSNGVDEIGFTSNLIDAVAAEFSLDESRVYASGYSNGANMGCYLSDRIAAVGAVAGSMWTWTEEMCMPTRPMPIMSIHGTNDFFNPYNGGPPFSLGLVEASEYWVQVANANATPDIVDVPNTVPNDGSTVDHYTWADGDSCVAIEHYKVNNGGHDWPGVFGNMDIDATQEIWDYVNQYSLNGHLDCVTTIDGDFNDDGVFDCADVDALVAEIVAGTNDSPFDLNGDGQVDVADMESADGWLAVAGAVNNASGGAYLAGDANLDGFVDVGDFNIWNENKFSNTAAWCQADFNYDGVTDVGDFNIWNENKFSASDVSVVPEPSSTLLVLFGLFTLPLSLRRRI